MRKKHIPSKNKNIQAWLKSPKALWENVLWFNESNLEVMGHNSKNYSEHHLKNTISKM